MREPNLCALFAGVGSFNAINETAKATVNKSIAVGRQPETMMTVVEHVESVCEAIETSNIDITANYSDWLDILFALSSDLGEEGRSFAHRISRFYVKGDRRYDPAEVDDKYTECLRNGKNQVHIGTLVKIAKDHGVTVKMPHVDNPQSVAFDVMNGLMEDKKDSLTAKVQSMLLNYASFRYNEILGCIEYKKKGSKEWLMLNDIDMSTFFSRLRGQGIKVQKSDLRAFIEDKEFSKSYNPFWNYVGGLRSWDPSQPDYIYQLFDSIVCWDKESQDFLQKYGRRWFVQMVGCMLELQPDNQLMLMLVGPQNVGKTYFCKKLLPPMLTEYSKLMTANEKLDKDLVLQQASKALIILDEFKQNKKDANTLKSILTQSESSVRAPYAQFAVSRKRHCSYIATGNDPLYIADASGDRRYITIVVKETKEISPETMPYEGAFAQALYILQHGKYDARLTREEVAEIEKHNESFVEPDLCECYIGEYFRKPEGDESAVWMTPIQIENHIKGLTYNLEHGVLNATNIGRVMRKWDVETKRPKNKKRYLLHEIQKGEQESEQRAAESERQAELAAQQETPPEEAQQLLDWDD